MIKTSLIELCIVLASGSYDPQAYTLLEISVEDIHVMVYTPEDKKHVTGLLCKNRELADFGKEILVVQK